MSEHPHQYLQVLGQLAREYQEKFAELESMIRDAPADKFVQQLGALGERTTDRFRSAQQAMFALLPGPTETSTETALAALTTLCRCFDEMRILCQILLERMLPSEER